MLYILLSAGISLILTLAAGVFLLPVLRRLKLGQKILEIGPNWHKSKEGTPTMGGFIFMSAISLAIIILGWKEMLGGNFSHLFILFFSWVYGIIGFIDDLAKIRKKKNQGLTASQKLFLQLTAAAAFLALLRFFGYFGDATTTIGLAVPFTSVILPIPWAIYLTLGILFVAGFVNAVNLADGADGLCTGEGLPVAIFFILLAWKMENTAAAIFAAALAGGLLGFLRFNFHPAKVFMGDTGALFIGGALCGLAFAVNQPMLLLICGLVYLLVMFSVILQVVYYKVTDGKRIFKMAPIHHHYELCGWSEKKVFTVFSAVSAVCCAAAWFGA
jgi:phospho-N-acetylmuramoyl-pentapeptide-transferase